MVITIYDKDEKVLDDVSALLKKVLEKVLPETDICRFDLEKMSEPDYGVSLQMPIENDVFKKVLMQVNDSLKEELYYEFQTHYKTVRLKLNDIIYFESKGRKIQVFLKTGEELEFYGRLDDVETDLREKFHCDFFVRKHKSYLVNESCIEKIEKNSLTLKGGKMLPISRLYQKV